jgi:two-component system sensor histidine kinase CiaH
MFESARLKLTAWYVLILMIISVLFSVAFYQSATSEVERVINRAQYRENHPNEEVPNRPPPPPDNANRLKITDLGDSKKELFITLLIINSGILVIAGGGAYFLAGRTLQPIKFMIDEQTQFIASASHELRTPIATMRTEMETSLLEKKLTDKKARELVVSNLEELSSLQNLTNILLTLARVHTVTNDIYEFELSLSDVLTAAEKKVKTLAQKKAITILQSWDNVRILGDKERITEVFVIVLENAIKYSSENTTIHVATVKHPQTAVVTVTDQGGGISETDLPRIFDRFFRADKSRSQTEGYGLGLSIAKKTVETHNGIIDVRSKLGIGTTVTITFPRKENV